MDWNLLVALSQIVATVGVLVTLIYLAKQIKQSNRQALLSSFRHTVDSLNQWALSATESEEVSALILRGRKSYKGLSETEKFRFDHVHLVFLNILESHYFQSKQTAMSKDYLAWAEENLSALVRGYLDHPGTLEFWGNVNQYYDPALRALVTKNTTQEQSALD